MIEVKKYVRFLCTLFICLILFQNCSVYHKESITLEEAAKKGGKVKMLMQDNQKIIFKKIIFNHNEYYGMNIIKRDTIMTLIKPNKIESLRSYNKNLSTIYSLCFGVVITFICLSVIYIIALDGISISGGGFIMAPI